MKSPSPGAKFRQALEDNKPLQIVGTNDTATTEIGRASCRERV